jgi:hypothetical protein
MGLWVKIWTDLLHDPWFMSLSLAYKGAYLMLIVMAKQQGDTGRIWVKSWVFLTTVWGANRKTVGKIVDYFTQCQKIKNGKNTQGLIWIELCNYEKWQRGRGNNGLVDPNRQGGKSARKNTHYSRVEKRREEIQSKSPVGDCSKSISKMRREEQFPTMLVYFRNFPFSKNLPEREQYKLAGKLIKKCLNRPEVATEFLHRRHQALSDIQTQEGFYKYINKPCGDPEFMGECESAAYKQDDGSQRGGTKSIKEILEGSE